jgi:ParB/RepB/Spo0J family partition protein
VAKLLEPLIPARKAFDDLKFTELCDSIRAFNRVLVPLLVEREGSMFRIHAGHRRYEACTVVGIETVACMVYDAGTVPGEAVKSHENSVREDLNAAEEADYFVRLLEGQCENDVLRLCALVRQPEGYVQQRLALKLGDARVFDALAAGLISIGVAGEFNKIRSPGYRHQYVMVAARGGCSIRQARDWRVAANNMPDQTADPATLTAAAAATPAPQPNSDPVCMFCNTNDDQYEIQVLFAHRSCLRAAERRSEMAGAQS